MCKGWLPMRCTINNQTTKQPLYFCDKVTHIYFSKTGCVDLNILPALFPYPMPTAKSTASTMPSCIKLTIPPHPNKIPFTPTVENRSKLAQYLCSNFSTTALGKSLPFPSMSAPPAHIYLKSNPVPYSKYTPIPVPFHWKQEAKELLDKYVKNGILQEVPIDTLVQWCSAMVLTAKKGKLKTLGRKK